MFLNMMTIQFCYDDFSILLFYLYIFIIFSYMILHMLKVHFCRDKEESTVIYEDRLLTGDRLKVKQILIGTLVDERSWIY
jgi:hypothetical protein